MTESLASLLTAEVKLQIVDTPNEETLRTFPDMSRSVRVALYPVVEDNDD